jgi:hypothetical protein
MASYPGMASYRGRELADLACAIADGAEVISDFRVMTDHTSCSDGPLGCRPANFRTEDE